MHRSSPLLAALWLVATSAVAFANPLSRADLHNWNNQAIFPNTTGAVRAADVNGTIGAVIDNVCVLDSGANCVLPSGAAATNLGLGTGVGAALTSPANAASGVAVLSSGGALNIGGAFGSSNLLIQGDGTNGYLRPTNAGSNLYLGAANNNIVSILGSGNVGLGTTSPSDALDVYGTGNTTLQIFGTSSPSAVRGGMAINSPTASAVNIGSFSNVPVAIVANNAEVARFGSGGNFGVGTTTPGYKLDVNGVARAGTFIGSGGGLTGVPVAATLIRWLSPTDPQFGAACDAATDDTTPLTNWATALGATTPPTPGYIPSKCLSKGAISWPVVNGLTVVGNGHSSMLIYGGANTTVTPFRFGASVDGCAMNGLTLKDFSFAARTVMTAGSGLLLQNICGLDWKNVKVRDEAEYHAGNWWQGAEMKGGNTNQISGYQFLAANAAEIVSADPAFPTRQYTDLFQRGGQIFGATIGVNIAGNFGGFTIDDTDMLSNGTQLRISQDRVSQPNSQVFLGPHAFLDATNGGAGHDIDVADAGGSGSILTLSGTWVASAQTECVFFENGVNWELRWSGGGVTNCGNTGVFFGATAVVKGLISGVSFNPTAAGFAPTSGYAIDCGATGEPNLMIDGIKLVGAWPTGNFSNCGVQGVSLSGSNARVSNVPQANTMSPTSGWQYDVSGQASIAVTSGSYVALPTGSGFVVVNDTATGDVSVWAFGGGGCVLVNTSSSRAVASTTSPAAGKYSLAYSGTTSAHTLFNNEGSTVNFTVALLRTRATN